MDESPLSPEKMELLIWQTAFSTAAVTIGQQSALGTIEYLKETMQLSENLNRLGFLPEQDIFDRAYKMACRFLDGSIDRAELLEIKKQTSFIFGEMVKCLESKPQQDDGEDKIILRALMAVIQLDCLVEMVGKNTDRDGLAMVPPKTREILKALIGEEFSLWPRTDRPLHL